MLNRNIIFKLGHNNAKYVDVNEGTIGWHGIDLQAYFSNKSLSEFDWNDYIEVGNRTNTAGAKNMFVLLQTIYNKLKNIDDGTYPAYITAYINDSDCGTDGTARVSWSANYNNASTYKSCIIDANFIAQCEDSIQSLYYRLTIHRYQYNNGRVEYSAWIAYNIAGPIDQGDDVDCRSEYAEIHVSAENANGDLVDYTDTGVSANGFKSSSEGRCNPDMGSFYSYDLTLYEK